MTEFLNWTEAIQKELRMCSNGNHTHVSITWSWKGSKTTSTHLRFSAVTQAKTDQQRKNKHKFINMSIHVYLADPQEKWVVSEFRAKCHLNREKEGGI